MYMIKEGGSALSSTSKHIYERNIKIIKEFYSSDFYKKLCNLDSFEKDYRNRIIKGIIEGMYLDPDYHDKQLLNTRVNAYVNDIAIDVKMKQIRYGLDGLCGWKQLYDYYNDDENADKNHAEKWLDDYETIRSSKCGNLIWPNRIKKGGQSINQERYQQFGDRIDYTLFDIKMYYEDYDQCRMKKSYANPETKAFLDSFKVDGQAMSSFENFIEHMGLTAFTNEKDVLDLDFELDNKKIISKEKHKEYSFCARWPAKMEKQYLKNILSICENDMI